MSSLSKRLSTRVVPLLSAAKRRQRLLKDLDPGNVTVPSRLFIGVTVSVSILEATEHRDVLLLDRKDEGAELKANGCAELIEPNKTRAKADHFIASESSGGYVDGHVLCKLLKCY